VPSSSSPQLPPPPQLRRGRGLWKSCASTSSVLPLSRATASAAPAPAPPRIPPACPMTSPGDTLAKSLRSAAPYNGCAYNAPPSGVPAGMVDNTRGSCPLPGCGEAAEAVTSSASASKVDLTLSA